MSLLCFEITHKIQSQSQKTEGCTCLSLVEVSFNIIILNLNSDKRKMKFLKNIVILAIYLWFPDIQDAHAVIRNLQEENKMGFCCKGFCIDFKAKRAPNGSRYEYGQKRCSLCSIFLSIQGARCPCCGAILRTKSRNKRLWKNKWQ